jgi:hypothetical protein
MKEQVTPFSAPAEQDHQEMVSQIERPSVGVPEALGHVVAKAIEYSDIVAEQTPQRHGAEQPKHKQGKPILSQPNIRRIYSPASGREFILLPFDVPLMSPLHHDDEPTPES